MRDHTEVAVGSQWEGAGLLHEILLLIGASPVVVCQHRQVDDKLPVRTILKAVSLLAGDDTRCEDVGPGVGAVSPHADCGGGGAAAVQFLTSRWCQAPSCDASARTRLQASTLDGVVFVHPYLMLFGLVDAARGCACVHMFPSPCVSGVSYFWLGRL